MPLREVASAHMTNLWREMVPMVREMVEPMVKGNLLLPMHQHNNIILLLGSSVLYATIQTVGGRGCRHMAIPYGHRQGEPLKATLQNIIADLTTQTTPRLQEIYKHRSWPLLRQQTIILPMLRERLKKYFHPTQH